MKPKEVEQGKIKEKKTKNQNAVEKYLFQTKERKTKEKQNAEKNFLEKSLQKKTKENAIENPSNNNLTI